jgi:RimJ/RimL family protein N-acetyltransferase
MHPLAPSPPAGDDPAGPRLVLRDGTVASVRRSTPADGEAMRRFFHELSHESRRKRFFTAGEPPAELVEQMCDSADERRRVTLVAVRQVGDDTRLIAVCSYFASGPDIAEAAFAVDDRFHGKGLATELLERLAAIAADHGFRRFEATTLTDNHAMLELFRDSGFEVRSNGARCPGHLDLRRPRSVVSARRATAARRRRRCGRCWSRGRSSSGPRAIPGSRAGGGRLRRPVYPSTRPPRSKAARVSLGA